MLLINQVIQEGIKMSKIKRIALNSALTLAVTIILGACGGGTTDKIIDQIDTEHSAKVSYINALDDSTTFYLKSTVYNSGLFDSQFEIVDLMESEVSEEIVHEWINGANQTMFGIENSYTSDSRASDVFDLEDNENYWAVSWDRLGENKVSVLHRMKHDLPGFYSVRIFTTSEMIVKNYFSDENLTSALTGIVTAPISVEGCGDLLVGGNEIDLCHVGTAGSSFLAIVDQNGQVVVVQE